MAELRLLLLLLMLFMEVKLLLLLFMGAKQRRAQQSRRWTIGAHSLSEAAALSPERCCAIPNSLTLSVVSRAAARTRSIRVWCSLFVAIATFTAPSGGQERKEAEEEMTNVGVIERRKEKKERNERTCKQRNERRQRNGERKEAEDEGLDEAIAPNKYG